MASPQAGTLQAPAPRLQSIDALRGVIIISMAIDHIRDFIHRGAMQFSPTDLARTTVPIFFTRWITHFCAPVFMLTAGLGAFLWMRHRGRSKAQLSRFLLSRGLWLIFLEVTILRAIIFFQVGYRGKLVVLLVIWVLGLCMIVLAGLIHLPTRILIALSVSGIVLHNLLDPIQSQALGKAAWVWDILHQQGLFNFLGINFVTAYPIVPWFAVMAAGYCLGSVYTWEEERRRRFLFRLGICLSVAFVPVRALNVYGDPARWRHQSSGTLTLLSFLNCTKYPPSLDFLLMTLGPAVLALAWLEGKQFSSANPVIVFGRVPFFFYVAHFLLAHLTQVALSYFRYGKTAFLFLLPPSMGTPANLFPSDYGYPLWAVYAMWLFVVGVLYPVCLWFSRLKQRRRDWWLSYL